MSSESAERGTISTSDGTTLAVSETGLFGTSRSYPEGTLAGFVVGSAGDEGFGVEADCAEELESGANVVLTLDVDIQRAAEEALDGVTGAVVVLDPDTGAVLALASSPSYDPSSGEEAPANQATTSVIPGSTFKTVAFAAALEDEGDTSSDTIYIAPSSIVLEEGSVTNVGSEQYGALTLHEAYTYSVNTVFAQVGMMLGADAIVEQAQRFGFGADLAQDFDCEVSTIEGLDSLTALGCAWLGCGQAIYSDGGATVEGPFATPVQMATVAATIANGGTVWRPYVVEAIEDADGVWEMTEAQAYGIALSSAHAKEIAAAMLSCVQEGTGTEAAVDGIDVRGKTGTAETASGYDLGWFIGYADDGERCIAFAIMIEDAAASDACSRAASIITTSCNTADW